MPRAGFPGMALRDGWRCSAASRASGMSTPPGATEDVLATWREVLGERAWVTSREEAIKDGWFGPAGTAVSDDLAAVSATWSPPAPARGAGGFEGRADRVLLEACTAR